MRTPEAEARRIIDELLTAAGWDVQDYARRNPGAARGVAIREFPLRTGAADYLLLVDRRPIGVVEATLEGWNVGTRERWNKRQWWRLEVRARALQELQDRIKADARRVVRLCAYWQEHRPPGDAAVTLGATSSRTGR